MKEKEDTLRMLVVFWIAGRELLDITISYNTTIVRLI